MSWELDGPILLDLLQRQKIPIWNYERNEEDPIVFGGGQVLTANPEPFASFFDVILLGDGENLLPSFIDKIQENRNLSRRDKLKALSEVPGVYIPILYTPIYGQDGNLISIKTNEPNIPEIILKQSWRSNILSHSTVITPKAAWPNIHMVEVVRSCPELCRFCLASYLNLPFRTASLEDSLIPAVEKGLKATKRIGLLGASVTQHPQFDELLTWVSQDNFNDVHLSVSSVRAATVTSKMTHLLAKRNCKSLTIAIESGSEKMRNIVNKKLSEEEIFSAAQYAKEGGLKGIKLYGMVGLPYENEKDIDLTVDLLLRVKQKNSSLRISFGLSTFVPKANTPFQWFGVRKEANNRIKMLSKKLKTKGIEVRPESYKWSLIQALISRSDRRLAPVIAAVSNQNNTLGGWKTAYKFIQEKYLEDEFFKLYSFPKLPDWEKIIHQDWNENKILPWEHLAGPLKKEKLIEHKQDAKKHL